MTNSSRFFVKQACFETRSQSLPNSLVFARDMSDAAKLLIIALNGMCTSGCNWTPRRDDIQNRLGWGRDKMTNTLKECVERGYLKIIKNRNEDGRHCPDDYEYDIYPSFLKEKVPSTESPSPVSSSPEKQPLQRTRRNNGEIEEQQQEEVVVSSKKKKLIEQYISPQIALEFMQYSLEQLQTAIAAMEQYKESQALKGKSLDSQEAYLRQALKQGWVARPTEKQKEQEAISQQEKEKSLIEKRYKKAKELMEKYQGKYQEGFDFNVTKETVFLKIKGRLSPLALIEENCLHILMDYIKRNLLPNVA